MKLSFVVPVYKVEAYLERCVNSILSQSPMDLEVILVDDGSPDRCGSICDAFAARDNRVRVIHKENGGLSSARNAALDVVTGDYIAFVDSDDYLEEKYIEVLKPLLETGRYDAIVFDWKNELSHGLESRGANLAEDASSGDIFRAILEDKTPCYVWNKIFKSYLWKTVRFPIGANFEDLAIMPFVFEKIHYTIYISEPLYIYNCTNAGSITSNLSARSKYGLFWSFYTRQQLAQKFGFDDLLPHFRLRAIRSAATALGFNVARPQLSEQNIETLLSYLREELESRTAPKVGTKYEILWRTALNDSPILRWYGNSMFALERLKKKFK